MLPENQTADGLLCLVYGLSVESFDLMIVRRKYLCNQIGKCYQDLFDYKKDKHTLTFAHTDAIKLQTGDNIMSDSTSSLLCICLLLLPLVASRVPSDQKVRLCHW